MIKADTICTCDHPGCEKEFRVGGVYPMKKIMEKLIANGWGEIDGLFFCQDHYSIQYAMRAARKRFRENE